MHLFKNVIEDLIEYYPQLKSKVFVESLLKQVTIPDTGIVSEDYVNLKDRVENHINLGVTQ